MSDQHVVHRVRGEYLEMPGLRLTFAQARRLWTLDVNTCESVLGSLVKSKFLVVTDQGQYARADLQRRRSAKASLSRRPPLKHAG